MIYSLHKLFTESRDERLLLLKVRVGSESLEWLDPDGDVLETADWKP